MLLFLTKILVQTHDSWDDREGANNDSALGMPLWAYILTVFVLLYIIIRLYRAIKKDQKNGKKLFTKK